MVIVKTIRHFKIIRANVDKRSCLIITIKIYTLVK